MNDNLHQRLALVSTLDCKVARRFAERPAMLDVAGELLVEHWQALQLGTRHDPLQLHLASHTAPGKTWVRPLVQVLVERYCQRHTLNLTPGDDFLTTHLDDSEAWQVAVDLHTLEQLINQAAPSLLERYKQRLVGYWSRFDRAGQTPWSWYARYLGRQMGDAIATSTQEGNMSGFALASATVVQAHPDAATRKTWPNTTGLTTSGLAIDLTADGKLDIDLSSAVLIEHQDQDPTRNLTLLYTLTGKLFAFSSRQALLQAISRQWPADSVVDPRLVYITPTTLSAFDGQALGLLNQQLHLIDTIAETYHSKLDAIALGLDLDRLTSMIDLCNRSETEQRQPLNAMLPDWLRDAPSRPLMRYSSLLIDVAQGYQDVNGQFWLDGIATAEEFANQRLAARLASDHPDQVLTPEQVKVVNYQTTATALPSAGGTVTSGEVTPVTFSLAQLAIGNLGLLKPGRVELSTPGGAPLPAWMDEAYLRTLVSELDIGSAYPAMLREKLLDDATRRESRERLLTNQLKSQLPALAMELFLRGKLDDSQTDEHVAQVFSTALAGDASRWVLRPLAFLKAADSSPDHPRNTWLIEPQTVGAGPCLLYRPLHADSLLSFHDRVALLVAISTPGELQDDMLSRLPADVHRFYAHGGFLEPHLFVPLDDTSAIPFGTPAPVRLAMTDAVLDPGKALYLACVNESIERFQAHSSTSAQTRWNSWKTLGWLLFNALLPLAGSSLGKVAWLAQMEVALADYVDTDSQRDPIDQQSSLVNLLVNIAMLLFSHSIFRLRLEQSEAPASLDTPQGSPQPVLPLTETNVQAAQLEFSWARPDRQLSSEQRTALQALRATVNAHALGTPIPSGSLRGLYLHDTRLYALLDANVFEVKVDSALNRVGIVGPDRSNGPWLMRDETQRWQLDLRLRLKGGQPLSERMQKLRLEKQQALDAARERVEADRALRVRNEREVSVIERLTTPAADDHALQGYQARLQQLDDFWTSSVQHLRQLNALDPVAGFKRELAGSLYLSAVCQGRLHNVLVRRYQPRREQFLLFARLHNQGETTDADIANMLRRHDTTDDLLQQMLAIQARIRPLQQELKRLANSRDEQIGIWNSEIANLPTTQRDELSLRYWRMEVLLNKALLSSPPDATAYSWVDKFWASVELSVAQRNKLLLRPDTDDEIRVRLLRSIRQQFIAAERQLSVLRMLLTRPDAQPPLQALQAALQVQLEQTAEDLAALPGYPETSTVQQMRSRAPGLIEVEEQGLLLGDPKANGTVEIPGPDNKASSRVYHLKHGNWVELQKPAPAPQRSQKKLKHLLKDGIALMAQARAEAGKLQHAPEAYLPVEIEETLLHRRDLLQAQADDIEHHLTTRNETDTASQGLDAEGTAKALRTLASELADKATQLRRDAALAQDPRMGEVQFLVEQGEVRIRREGARTRLAKVAGRPDDYIDEFSISHRGRALWYAHFHYPNPNTPSTDFIAGHLKTAAQRYQTGPKVYYREITHNAAQRYFFDH